MLTSLSRADEPQVPPPHRRAITPLLFLLILVTLGLVLYVRPHYSGENPTPSSSAAQDLMRHSHMISDWLFLQLHSRGLNGYDPQQLSQEADRLFVPGLVPPARLSPPWYYLGFAPSACLSPSLFLWLTFLLTIGASIVAANQSVKLLNSTSASPLFLTTAVITFPPFLQNILAGQVSIFITVIMLLSLQSFFERHYLCSGIWAALLSAKPQSTYLVVIAIAFLCFTERRYRFFYGYAGCLLLLAGLSYLAAPELFPLWQATRFPLETQTVTLATPVRALLLSGTGRIYNWPIFAVPALVSLATLVLLVRLPSKRINLVLLLTPCLSTLSAPYGWFYDSSNLIVSHVALVCIAMQKGARGGGYLALAAFTATNLLTIGWMLGGGDYRWLLLYPLTMTLLSIALLISSNRTSAFEFESNR